MYGKCGSEHPTSKKIIEMLVDGTIKTYENAVDFIKKNKEDNIKVRSLNGCCARKKYFFLKKYCVSYEEDFNIEEAKKAINQIKEYKKYDIPFYELNENLEIIKKYESLYSLTIDIEMSKIKRVLNKKCNNVFGRKFIFENEYLNMTKLELKKRFSIKYVKSQKVREGKKIKCLNDNNVFISISQASNFYKMSKDSIGKGLSGERKHCGYYNNEQMFFQYI